MVTFFSILLSFPPFKDLDDAIKRRHLETLEKAIEHGQKSRFSNKVQTEIRDAEELRDHLRLLNRIAHDVLEMKQTTIAELYSYKAPQPIIFDVMHTTFIMLGENPSHIEVNIIVVISQPSKHALVSDSWPGGFEFDTWLKQTFLPVYSRLSHLNHERKVVGGFGNKSCVRTGVRKPGNTCVYPTATII